MKKQGIYQKIWTFDFLRKKKTICFYTENNETLIHYGKSMTLCRKQFRTYKKTHKYIWDFDLQWKRTIAMVLHVYQNYGTIVYIHS